MLTRFQGDFERVCSILSTFSTSVSGGSRNEVPRLIASLLRQSLRRCKSAAVPCSHLFLALTYGPCSRLSCQDGKKQWNKSRCNCFSQKKKKKPARKASSLSEHKSRSDRFLFLEGKQSYDAKAERQECHKTGEQGWMGLPSHGLFFLHALAAPQLA